MKLGSCDHFSLLFRGFVVKLDCHRHHKLSLQVKELKRVTRKLYEGVPEEWRGREAAYWTSVATGEETLRQVAEVIEQLEKEKIQKTNEEKQECLKPMTQGQVFHCRKCGRNLFFSTRLQFEEHYSSCQGNLHKFGKTTKQLEKVKPCH